MGLEEMRARNANGKLDKLIKATSRTSMGKKTTYTKDVTYYPERNAEGNGSAIIRFLPGLDSEDNPYYVEKFQHGFQENGKWYVENCPSTIGREDCPVCNENFDIIKSYGQWDDCPEDVKKYLGKKRGRSSGYEAGYFCNILVIKDPANPDNEGKVFKFKYGRHIHNLIMEKAQPVDNGFGVIPEAIDVFDLESGANFMFIIRKKDNMANYDKSEFEKSSPCPKFNAEDQVPLLTITHESQFKTASELNTIYAKVMNKTVPTKSAEEMAGSKSADSTPVDSKKATDVVSEPEGLAEDVPDDDNLAYFQSLANEVNI